MNTQTALLLGLGLLAMGCGGGGGPAALDTVALQGLVVEVDGQTANRAGIQVGVEETGDTAITDFNGSFLFEALLPGTITLRFGAATAQSLDDSPITRIEDTAGGESFEVRASMSNGTVTRFSSSSHQRRRAEVGLTRDPASPDGNAEGKVKVESRDDREKITIEAEHLDAFAVVDFLMKGPDDPDFVNIGTIVADSQGDAELERNTRDGDSLPLGKSTVDELAGFLVEIRTGPNTLRGVVPELAPSPTDDDSDDDSSGHGHGHGHGHGGEERERGKARLQPAAAVSGAEGHVELRKRPDGQRFKMEAEHLPASVTAVTFQIKDPATGFFVDLAAGVTVSGGEAEISTQDGLAMPLGKTDVADLVGLAVQVLDAATGDVILTGTSPELMPD